MGHRCVGCSTRCVLSNGAVALGAYSVMGLGLSLNHKHTTHKQYHNRDHNQYAVDTNAHTCAPPPPK